MTLACVVVERGAAAFISAGGPIEFLVVQNDPTLDDMLATILLEQSLRGEPLPPGAEAFSRYAAICREGLRPSNLPLEDSLEGMFLAVRSGFPDDLSPVEEGRQFLEAWAPLAQRILEACRTGTDPFVTPLFRDRPQFARQHAYLARPRGLPAGRGARRAVASEITGGASRSLRAGAAASKKRALEVLGAER